MSKRFLVILAALFIVFGGLIYASKHNKSNNNQTGNNPAQQQNLSNNVIGGGSSGVELTEYGDFQCPACLQFEPIMREIREKYKDTIIFRFRNFPLSQIHKNAQIAARAGQAAAQQNKFWEMHDLLYDNQDTWASSPDPSTFFSQLATQLGLDQQKFLSDMRSSETNDVILADLADAQQVHHFNGTPSFTLNGQNLERPQDKEAFFKILDEAIAKKQSEKKS